MLVMTNVDLLRASSLFRSLCGHMCPRLKNESVYSLVVIFVKAAGQLASGLNANFAPCRDLLRSPANRLD